jgi:hypothetical protein
MSTGTRSRKQAIAQLILASENAPHTNIDDMLSASFLFSAEQLCVRTGAGTDRRSCRRVARVTLTVSVIFEADTMERINKQLAHQ